VSGKVSDPSGASVAGASIWLHARDGSAKRATITNEDGNFSFDSVPGGDYLLEVETRDFAQAALGPFTISPGTPRQVDVQLELARVRDQVTVTTSGTPLRIDEISKALDTVDLRQMERRGEYSIPEALRNIPGLRVQQQQGPGSLTTIQIRGLRTTDTAFLVDGFRLRDAADTQGSANPFLQDLLIVDTERVEILRGSGSSLYGTHALAGVVNIVTNSGGGESHGELKAEGGGLGFLRGLARFGGGAARNRLLYSGGFSHLNVVDGVDGNDAYRNSSAQGSLSYRSTPSTSLGGRIFTSGAFLQPNDSPSVPAVLTPNLPSSGPIRGVALPREQQRLAEAGKPFAAGTATFMPDADDPDYQRSSSFFAGLLTFSQQLSPSASYRLAYQGVKTRRDFFDGPGGISFEPEFNNASRFDGRIDVLEARTEVTAGSHLFSLGYEFERESYDSPSSDDNPDTSQSVDTRAGIRQRSHSLFAQDQMRLLQGKLQLSLSGRLQTFDLSNPEFTGGPSPYAGAPFEKPPAAYTGDVAVSYFASKTGTKWRAHLGNAYRSAALFERFGSSFFFGSFSAFGDPRLRPERSVGLDTGIDQYLFRDRLRLSATYFYTYLQETIFFDFSGVIEPSTDPFGRFGGYRNIRGGLARGAELSVTASPARSLDLTAAYTYTNSDQRISPGVLGGFSPAYGISNHMFSLTALQRIGRRVDLAFDLFAASQYDTPFFLASGSSRVFRIGGPVKADVVGSYTIPVSDSKSVKLYGKIENVFDRAYFEDGFRSPGVWGAAGLTFHF